MSKVKGERTEFLDKRMLLDLRKMVQRGDKAGQKKKNPTHNGNQLYRKKCKVG